MNEYFVKNAVNRLLYFFIGLLICLLPSKYLWPQSCGHSKWIRPQNMNSPAKWGMCNGLVIGLWPTHVGTFFQGTRGGPRGLLRIGYNLHGRTYLINYIAIEPVVNGKKEYSEISPSRVDGKIGKFIWASKDTTQRKFYPSAITRGTITHPDPDHPNVEQLSFYLFMEKFLNGAHPYLKVTIRSDRPNEIGFQIFNQKDSAPMEQCPLTATMGNYSRIRLLYMKDKIIDSRKLYKGFDGIHFVEKEPYSADKLIKTDKGYYIALAATNESFSELASWPQDSSYLSKQHWRYRPPFKVTQYWKTKVTARSNSSLHVRVNGRAKYWSGKNNSNSKDYIDVPGGVAFENFEMREKYHPGQKFYFGITRKSPRDMKVEIPKL